MPQTFAALPPALELSFLGAGGPRLPATYLAAQASSAPNDGATRHGSDAVSLVLTARPKELCPLSNSQQKSILALPDPVCNTLTLNPIPDLHTCSQLCLYSGLTRNLTLSVICCARVQGNPEISKARWTAEEDKQLGQLVADHGNAWARIARQLPGRTDQQCMVHPCT